MKHEYPLWDIPQHIEELIVDDAVWEDDRWYPILLTVMGGTSYKGRDIPLAWQIEFEPYGDEFLESNQKIIELGAEPDGYGWANAIHSVIKQYHPEIIDELHPGDSDTDTCMIWVESEASCKLLMQVAWALIHGV